ncbi:RNA polymerase subunit sigma-70 [Spirillospora sp. NBC_01491]|uniref:RNA polymerase subunit sigma-70 n=1 Tax=Spirillospora sp. NBC_01491 TaxID=2976007 RepID=UPI002E364060|nr:RNA polymerase subunit sigma-70 [Spirillospora sp. NBC_01491]
MTSPTRPRPATGHDDFADRARPHRPELLAYCYRMLGSVHDAEDLVQETYLRAGRKYDSFEECCSVRTWLYRIATNACLTALENRERRPLPAGVCAPSSDPGGPFAAAWTDVAWLQPAPDALLIPPVEDPAVVAVRRGTLRLALIAALQLLPPRQRAVLILRDVLAMRAAEVAGLLGTSVPAVKSLLQRARARLDEVAPSEDDAAELPDAERRELLDRYLAAFENADVAALLGLLTRDAVLEMPPYPAWFAGRDAVGAFLAAHVLTRPGLNRVVRTAANGQPAMAVYRQGPDGVHGGHWIMVLDVSAAGVGRITAFREDLRPFDLFGLPRALPLEQEAVRGR